MVLNFTTRKSVKSEHLIMGMPVLDIFSASNLLNIIFISWHADLNYNLCLVVLLAILNCHLGLS